MIIVGRVFSLLIMYTVFSGSVFSIRYAGPPKSQEEADARWAMEVKFGYRSPDSPKESWQGDTKVAADVTPARKAGSRYRAGGGQKIRVQEHQDDLENARAKYNEWRRALPKKIKAITLRRYLAWVNASSVTSSNIKYNIQENNILSDSERKEWMSSEDHVSIKKEIG